MCHGRETLTPARFLLLPPRCPRALALIWFEGEVLEVADVAPGGSMFLLNRSGIVRRRIAELERALEAARAPRAAVGYELTKTGIVFHRVITDREHEALGRRIAVVANATPWQFGDWLVAGTGRYEEAGSTYERVHALTGRSVETIGQWLKVALAYSHEERGLVPWTLYREALRLPAKERLRALEVARANRWSRTDLVGFIQTRFGLAGERQAASVEAAGAPQTRHIGPGRVGRPAGMTRVRCPHCSEVFEARGNFVPVEGQP